MIVVVGGGVIGLGLALELRLRGAEVTVLEARRVGRGASWGNAGWIVPSLAAPLPGPGAVRAVLRSLGRPGAPVRIAPRPDPALIGWAWRFLRHCDAATHERGTRAVAELAVGTHDRFDAWEQAGVTFARWRSGLLFAAVDPTRLATQRDAIALLAPYGVAPPGPLLDRGALLALEPHLAPAVAGGFAVPGEEHVDPGTLVEGLAAYLRASGVAIVEGVAVTRLAVTAGGRVRGAVTAAGEVAGDAVVVACGARSAALLRPLGVRLPLQAGVGYSFGLRPPAPPRHPLYLLEAKVGVTPLGDRVRVAGTMELGGTPGPRRRARRLAGVATAASRYLGPGAQGPRDEAWSGARPVTPDGLPVIGAVPGHDGLYVSTGHAMLGVTLAPASAALLARVVLDGHVPAVARPFAPDRFR